MRKKVFLVFLLLSMFALVFANNIEAVLQEAKVNSSVYQGYEINHQNTLIQQQQRDLNGVSVSVSGGYEYSDKLSAISPSTVTVSVPDLYEGIKLNLSANIGQISTKESQPVSVSPTLSVSKDFEINSFEDTREDLEELKSELQTEINYQTNLYNFENNLINTIVSILQSESRLKSSETSYERSLKTYENDVKLGSIEEGSLTDIEQRMRLESSRASLESTRVNYEKSLNDFVQQYGIDFPTITEVRDADLTFTPSETGNSTVLISYYNLLVAQQEYEAQQGFSDKLSLSGSASTSLTMNTDKKTDSSINVNASVKYTASTWEVSTSLKDTWGENQTFSPSVSIFGKWSSSTTKTESDGLNLQKLYNNVLSQESSYNNALYSYKTNAQTLQRDISTNQNDLEQLRIQTEYHKTILDYQNQLYVLGLTTAQNVEDAQTNYDNDLTQEIILKLQALVLENKIKTIEL